MTTQQLLRFSGSVLGPALLAQAMADLLAAIPQSTPSEPQADTAAVDLLSQVFPDGMTL